MNSLIRYVKQPSTLKGIIVLLGALGIQISPEQSSIIITAAGLAYGAYQVLRDEDKQLGR